MAICLLPVVGPLASLVYVYRYQFQGQCNSPFCIYAATLQQQHHYAQLGLVNSLLTLAAIVAGVAAGLFSNPFLIGSLLLTFGAVGIVHQTILSQIDDRRKSPPPQKLFNSQKVAKTLS